MVSFGTRLSEGCVAVFHLQFGLERVGFKAPPLKGAKLLIHDICGPHRERVDGNQLDEGLHVF